MVKDRFKKRLSIFGISIVLAFALVAVRLLQIQIIEGQNYLLSAERRALDIVPLSAARGKILDRYGRPLVINESSLAIVIHKKWDKKLDLNQIIYNLIVILESSNHFLDNHIPMNTQQDTSMAIEPERHSSWQHFVKKLVKERKISENATQGKILEALIERYNIDTSKYSDYYVRKILDIRYDMESKFFSTNNPYIIARNIDVSIAVKLKEQNQAFGGVNIIEEPKRKYAQEGLATHILGRVGGIFKEEYEQLKKQGYSMNEVVGKDGLEKYLESELRGKDGFAIDNTQRNSKILGSLAPLPGNDVMLTIDLKLQQVLEQSLSKKIESIQGATGGSGVVINVKTGEILAIASYPTYIQSDFSTKYKELSQDPKKPLLNRSISGLYSPGSTFKMLVAAGALKEGVIGPTEKIQDHGIYKYFAGYHPRCAIYKSSGHTHGLVDVPKALQHSCNYFFFDIGRKLGIEKLVEYCKRFGFGSKTGIELGGESSGWIASPETKEKFHQQWNPGDILSAAIGQGDHQYTPLQLANYVAIIANGGLRYKLTLVKSIHDPNHHKLIKAFQPELIEKLDFPSNQRQAIVDGMYLASKAGTASSVFGYYKVPVCSKTGTAEVSGVSNGLFVAFAPKNDPEIAIAIIVEHGKFGGNVGSVAKDVMDAYFASNTKEENSQEYNTLKI